MNNEMYDHHAMVALLPSNNYFSGVEMPHLTLVYLGKLSDLKQEVFQEVVYKVSHLASLISPFNVTGHKLEVLGPPGDQVEALTFKKHPKLSALRYFLEEYNASEYKEFKPHITINKRNEETFALPDIVNFEKMVVSWGAHDVVFKLRGT